MSTSSMGIDVASGAGAMAFGPLTQHGAYAVISR